MGKHFWRKIDEHLNSGLIAHTNVRDVFVATVYLGSYYQTFVFGTEKYAALEEQYFSLTDARNGHRHVVDRLHDLVDHHRGGAAKAGTPCPIRPLTVTAELLSDHGLTSRFGVLSNEVI